MSGKATPFRFRQLLPLIAAIVVLPFNLNARTYRTISHFDYSVNGGNIEHGVTLDAAGNLYGTTLNGGPLDYRRGIQADQAAGRNLGRVCTALLPRGKRWPRSSIRRDL